MTGPTIPTRRASLAAALGLALAFALPGAHAQDAAGTTADEAASDETMRRNAEAPATETAAGASDGDGAAGATECEAGDDFPTTAVADYVLGCMAANGNTYEALQQCSCSIDFIKARMDYKAYEQAGTVLQVQRDVGQRGTFYRDSNWAKTRVERLEALQAESTLRCF